MFHRVLRSLMLTTSLIVLLALSWFVATPRHIALAEGGLVIPSTYVTAGQSTCSVSYFDNFSSYPVGRSPSGYLLRGASGAVPRVQQYGGGNVLAFPYVSWQYWDSWALKGGLVLQAPYTVKVKINYQTAVADRGGLTVAWNDADWDHIDIQPNVYWEDLEIRITYTGPIPASPVVKNLAGTSGSLPIHVGTDYWLQIAATSSGPGQGQLVVSWSTDGTTFSTIATISGLADVSGLAGMSTAGPNLPNTYFTNFQIGSWPNWGRLGDHSKNGS